VGVGDGLSERPICPLNIPVLLKPSEAFEAQKKDERVKSLSVELSILKTENTKLEGRLNKADQTIEQKDKQNSDLASAYLTLAKFIHEKRGEQPKEEKEEQPKKGSASYEGTNV